jgi:hypothetical protein
MTPAPNCSRLSPLGPLRPADLAALFRAVIAFLNNALVEFDTHVAFRFDRADFRFASERFPARNSKPNLVNPSIRARRVFLRRIGLFYERWHDACVRPSGRKAKASGAVMNTRGGGSSSGEAGGAFSNRVRRIFKGVGLWLDARAVRAYPQDTHSWAAKTETLRALKTVASWPAAHGCKAPAMPQAASRARVPVLHGLGPHVAFGAIASSAHVG